MSLGINAKLEIETKTVCDDINCQACYCNDDKRTHSGKTETLISHDYLSYGDYDNSCAVERANVRYCEENNLVALKDTEMYGYAKVWLKDTEENRELINALNNYPAIDDELINTIKDEIETEYIKDNDDITRLYTEEPLKSVLMDANKACIIPDVYYKACEQANIYFEVEAGGNGHIDLERLAKDYNLILCERYPFLKTLCEVQETIKTAPVFPIDFYDSAEDMQNHKKATGQIYNQDEIKDIVEYACELELLLEKLIV